MRIIMLSLSLLLLCGHTAAAQSSQDPPQDNGPIRVEQMSRRSAMLKGAIIGGAIGAFLGTRWVAGECGTDRCPAAAYAGGAAYIGGLGAFLGAKIGADFARSIVGRQPGFGAVVSRRKTAAVVSLRF